MEKFISQTEKNTLEFEEVSMDTCLEVAQKIIEQGLKEYFEGVPAVQAIHRARELRYVFPMLELSGQEDLKNSLQESVIGYVQSEQTTHSIYMVSLYLKQIVSQIEKPVDVEKEHESLDVKKIAAFSYGRVFDDPTVIEPEIKIIDLHTYTQSLQQMKQKDAQFAEYMNTLPLSEKTILKTLNRALFYPGLLSDGTSPQMNLSWKPLSKEDLATTTHAEISEEDIKDFIALKGNGMNKIVSQEFNLDLSYYTLPEQFQFLSYIKKAPIEDIESLKNVFQNIPHTQVMEVFSALEGTDASLVKICTDAFKTLSPQAFQAILAVYHRALMYVKTFDSTFDQKVDMTEEDRQQVRYAFQTRLLKRISSSLKNNLQNGLDANSITEWILEQDAQLNRDISKDVMKALLDERVNVTVEMLKEAKISLQDMSEMSKEELSREAEEYYRVWALSENKPAFAQALKESFEERINNIERLKKSRLYVFSIGNERVSSVIIEDVEDQTKYVSTLYVNENFRNGSFARPFINEVYSKEKKDSTITLQGDPVSPSVQIAFENGFVGTDFKYATFSNALSTDEIPVFSLLYIDQEQTPQASEYIEVDKNVLTQTIADLFFKENEQLTIVSYQKNNESNTVRLGIFKGALEV